MAYNELDDTDVERLVDSYIESHQEEIQDALWSNPEYARAQHDMGHLFNHNSSSNPDDVIYELEREYVLNHFDMVLDFYQPTNADTGEEHIVK